MLEPIRAMDLGTGSLALSLELRDSGRRVLDVVSVM